LADLGVLPRDQAIAAGADLPGNERECGRNTNMDCADRHLVFEIPANEIANSREPFDVARDDPLESAPVLELMGMAIQALWRTNPAD